MSTPKEQGIRYVRQIKRYIGQGYKVAVDMDLSKFFDTVNHDVLMYRVSRRIRRCYWKQWRYVRTKVRNLLNLGTYMREAILTSLSRKGLWHSARTLATQAGMTNKWLAEQGLISVKEQWVKIHYPATARLPDSAFHYRFC